MNFYGMNTENKSENNAGTCVFFPVTSQAVAGHSTNYSQSSINFIREPLKVEKNCIQDFLYDLFIIISILCRQYIDLLRILQDLHRLGFRVISQEVNMVIGADENGIYNF